LARTCRYIVGNPVGNPEEESVVKIDSALQHVSSVQSKGVKSKTSKGGKVSAGSSSVSDNVQLTDTSSRLRELEMQLSDVPMEDAGKVESIRQAIADGSFKVDEEAVAESMVRESIEQLRHRPSQ